MAAPHHDWYLNQWLTTLRVKQSHLAERIGWQKSKISRLATGETPYDRDILNACADGLNIAPFELLLHPEEAMAIRRMRESAVRIAAENRLAYSEMPDITPFPTGKRKIQ